MKTLTLAAIRCSLMFTAVAALSLAYPASVQAVPATNQYTGNHFTFVYGDLYTTSDFVTAVVTLAAPLRPNMPLTVVTPTFFRLSDGVQTVTINDDYYPPTFMFATDASGAISMWELSIHVLYPDPKGGGEGYLNTFGHTPSGTFDGGYFNFPLGVPVQFGYGYNMNRPGWWRLSTPDAGSTLSLMTLTLMALGAAARRFKRAAAFE